MVYEHADSPWAVLADDQRSRASAPFWSWPWKPVAAIRKRRNQSLLLKRGGYNQIETNSNYADDCRTREKDLLFQQQAPPVHANYFGSIPVISLTV